MSKKSGLFLVNAGNDCLQFWPTVQAFMEEGRKYPQPIMYGAAFAMDRIYKGEWQLWLLHENDEIKLMMITYVVPEPAGKTLFIELVIGEGIFDLIGKNKAFEAWAKSENIALIQTSTPRPLAKFSKRYGWKEGNVTVYKWLEVRQ